MKSNRSHEFDKLWDRKKYPSDNIQYLLNLSIPYSFNLFAKGSADIAKAREIIDHLQKGYPHEDKRIDFTQQEEDLYAYLLMVRANTAFEDPTGEIARKLNYALDRLNFHQGFNGIHEDRFKYRIAELVSNEERKGCDSP